MVDSIPSIWPHSALPFFISLLAGNRSIALLQQDLIAEAAGHRIPIPHYTNWLSEFPILLKLHCIEVVPFLSSSYISLHDTAIHPIFSSLLWDRTGVQEFIDPSHDAMRPAIALATKWITSDLFLGWWIRVLYGTFETDKESGKLYLAASPKEHDFPQAKADLEKAFAQLAENLRYYWKPEDENTAATSRNPWMALWGLDNQRWDAEADAHINEFAPCINLPTIFLYHLLSPRGARQASTCSNLRLQFHIAKTLVHELAHAFHMFVHRDKCEPYIFLEDWIPEAGFSWEQFVFGCDVTAFPFKLEGIGAVCAMEFEHMHAFPGICVPLAMRWVEKWFLNETWNSAPDIEFCNPITAEKLLKRYQGLIYADRFLPSANLWSRVLYQNQKPVGIQSLAIPGAPPPMGMRFNAMANLGMIPHRWNIQEWFDQVREKDIEAAVASGFDRDSFVKGRSKVYQAQCYDNDGIGPKC
ncbi:hypothetical protein K505DRAFT_343863 [Melanomma pulvis-pyrius CBS 109.77]|uniref:Uncharacterized protein n=1 Tax=Melanomma pulvis-pyrius CBS 109.77 TaxID=1314802 RepID=A0A6A6WQK1_9PLEO|nr:hypothetical protein K505DRAFT_343863 [Melanomma pulvis-pyrius CBS 109.77]